jgi:hypothetical protein
MGTCASSFPQRFRAVFDPTNRAYKLENILTAKCIDVDGASKSSGGNISQQTCNGGASQLWTPEDLGGALYRLSNRNSGLVFDLAGAQSTSVGTNLAQGTYDGSADQKFQIVPVTQSHISLLSANPATSTSSVRYNTSNQFWSETTSGDDKAFKVRPGLSDASCISFESKAYPGSYLHQRDYVFYLEAPTPTFDATFCPQAGISGVANSISLVPKNYSSYFMWQSAGRLRMHTNDNTAARGPRR